MAGCFTHCKVNSRHSIVFLQYMVRMEVFSLCLSFNGDNKEERLLFLGLKQSTPQKNKKTDFFNQAVC